VIARTRELTVAKEAADAANRAKSAFLANMSHEIRTPLNSVIGMTQLALELARDPTLRDYLEKTYAAGQHLLGLISDVLDMSKIEGGKLQVERLGFRFRDLLARVEAQMSLQALSKGLGLSLEYDPRLERRVVGDPLRLEQVLVNFVGNAIKFTERGSVAIAARVVDESQAEAWIVRVDVRDTGPGLAPDVAARLFQVFQQGDSSTTRRYGGTGLGLAISKELVALMGGEVGVKSEPGRGSTFWFTVRLGLADDEAAAPPTAAPQEAGVEAIAGTHILLVEDNEANQIVAAAMLRQVGAQVAVACNGVDALEYLRGHRVDCVLMDLQMPRMDGLEATRRIRADPRLAGTIVVAMTANAWNEDREACLAAGMDDFVTKPIDRRRLHAALARWLRRPLAGAS
jgi:CheY-like chemotaxis protein